MDIIAHRGASAYAPENTLASFRKAIELKADWFELDCTLTQDDEVIVIYDDDLQRTTDGTGKICDATLAKLKTLDAGTWYSPEFTGERLPTLHETLEFAKDRIGVYIEVKDSDDDKVLCEELLGLAQGHERLIPELNEAAMSAIKASASKNLVLARKVIALVRANGMQTQAAIQSFSPIVCAVTLMEAPDLRCELLGCSDKDKAEQWPWFLEWLRLLNPAGFNPHHSDVDAELVDALHAEGKSIAVWTVDEEVELQRLIQLGVDAVITNKPDLARNVLESA